MRAGRPARIGGHGNTGTTETALVRKHRLRSQINTLLYDFSKQRARQRGEGRTQNMQSLAMLIT